jgi:hypothetical protein
MRYLVAFLFSLLILAAAPVFAQEEPNKGCVTPEKFVSQNADTAPVTWNYTLKSHEIQPVLEALNIPPGMNITEVRLFTANVLTRKPEAGIAFGHDGLVCVFAQLHQSGVLLVKQVLEALKGTEL